MRQAFWWRWDGSDHVHGPCARVSDVLDAACAMLAEANVLPHGIFIGTAAQDSLWRTSIFGMVDQMFDTANAAPAARDDPPSCAWSPAHIADLRRGLEEVLAAWLDRHGYQRRPAAADIEWHIAFSAREMTLTAIARDLPISTPDMEDADL